MKSSHRFKRIPRTDHYQLISVTDLKGNHPTICKAYQGSQVVWFHYVGNAGTVVAYRTRKEVADVCAYVSEYGRRCPEHAYDFPQYPTLTKGQ